ERQCDGARDGCRCGGGGRDDAGREAGAARDGAPQLVRPRPHAGTAAGAPRAAGLGAAGAELDDALGPGHLFGRRARDDGGARLPGPGGLLHVHEPPPPQRPDPRKRDRRRRPALDLARGRAGHRPPAQGRLRLHHRRRGRLADRGPRAAPGSPRGLDDPHPQRRRPGRRRCGAERCRGGRGRTRILVPRL
ncbi:MAG: FIG00803858: hypothetical protein, partial [uncultured Gemmatimonadetes bacterium]